jgi:hypothetical protein
VPYRYSVTMVQDLKPLTSEHYNKLLEVIPSLRMKMNTMIWGTTYTMTKTLIVTNKNDLLV